MLHLLAIDWNINPLMFLEFFVVLAFGIGWFILEKVANSYDRKREDDKAADLDEPSAPP